MPKKAARIKSYPKIASNTRCQSSSQRKAAGMRQNHVFWQILFPNQLEADFEAESESGSKAIHPRRTSVKRGGKRLYCKETEIMAIFSLVIINFTLVAVAPQAI